MHLLRLSHGWFLHLNLHRFSTLVWQMRAIVSVYFSFSRPPPTISPSPFPVSASRMCQEGKSKYANAKVSGGAGVSQQGQKQVSMAAPTYRACKSKCCTTRPPRGHCTRARLLNGWIPSSSPGASAKDHQCHSVRPRAGTRTAHIPWGIILIHLFEF